MVNPSPRPPFTHSILFNVATNLVLSFLVQCPGHQNIYLLLFINEDFILWNFIVMVNKPFSSVAEDGLLKKRRLRNIEENWDRQQAERRFKEQSSESKGCYAVHSTPSEDSMHHSATVHPNPPELRSATSWDDSKNIVNWARNCEIYNKETVRDWNTFSLYNTIKYFILSLVRSESRYNSASNSGLVLQWQLYLLDALAYLEEP